VASLVSMLATLSGGQSFRGGQLQGTQEMSPSAYLNRYLRSHRYSVCGVGVEVDAGDARRWAEHFAAASYGDSLLAAALSLLLRPEAPPAVQARSGFSFFYLCWQLPPMNTTYATSTLHSWRFAHDNRLLDPRESSTHHPC